MPITVVDRQLNDSSYAASPFSTKADSSCYRSAVKSGEAALVFSILFFIMADPDEKTSSMRLIDFGGRFFGGINGSMMKT